MLWTFKNVVKRHKCFVAFGLILVVSAMFACGLLLMLASWSPTYIETSDVSDYGDYSGTGSEQFVCKYIDSFFPKRIEDAFRDVKYSYKAENADTYGFEVYLEFVIDEPAVFDRYVSSIAGENQWRRFEFDHSFLEYDIDDVFCADPKVSDDPGVNTNYRIIQAKIRKILCCPETGTIIYYALGVYDGGVADTGHFDALFRRFGIDPASYEKTADPMSGNDPYEI